jgi:hypothetical protein
VQLRADSVENAVSVKVNNCYYLVEKSLSREVSHASVAFRSLDLIGGRLCVVPV